MRRFKLLILCLFISMVNAYGQSMNRIKVEHIGEVDKPFAVIELCLSNSNEQKTAIGGLLVIADSNVFHRSIEYFDSKFVGELEPSNFAPEYGMFLVSFFDDEGIKRKIILDKEGAIYFFVNLHTFIPSDEESRVLISGMVRRLF